MGNGQSSISVRIAYLGKPGGNLYTEVYRYIQYTEYSVYFSKATQKTFQTLDSAKPTFPMNLLRARRQTERKEMHTKNKDLQD